MKRSEVAEFDVARSSTVERLLDAIEAGGVLPPHVTPTLAVVATVSALLERLTAGQAHEFVTALPADIRPLFEHARAERQGKPLARVGRAELVDRVADDLAVAPVSAEPIVATVFHALASILPQEQIAHVAQQLPHGLRDLWLAPAVDLTEDVRTDPELFEQVLGDIDASGALPPRVSARAAFVAVMSLLGERLSGGEAKRLLLGLPRTVRPLVEAAFRERRGEGAVTFGSEELAALVATELDVGLEDADAVIAAVFAAVTRVLPRDELVHVASQLPDDLRRIWSA